MSHLLRGEERGHDALLRGSALQRAGDLGVQRETVLRDAGPARPGSERSTRSEVHAGRSRPGRGGATDAALTGECTSGLRSPVSDRIESLRATARGSGLFVDFDGTLSEIAPTPEAAVPVPGAPEALARPRRRSGWWRWCRGVRRRRCGRSSAIPPACGGSGCTGWRTGSASPDDAFAASLVPLVRDSVSEVEGIRLEPKGRTLAVHYRQAADPEAVRQSPALPARGDRRGRGPPPDRGQAGDGAGPGDVPTKGDVIREPAGTSTGWLYAGDDLADLQAFGAVDELAATARSG